MKHLFFVISFSIVLNISTYAQSNPLDKKLDKAYSYIKKEKYDDAADYLVDLLKENPEYGEGWDLLVKVRGKQYEASKSSDLFMKGSFTITTKDKDGNDVNSENDTLAQSLMKILSNISPSKNAKKKYLDEARRATCRSKEAYYSSILLRNTFVDTEIDTNVSKKALKYFYDAESEFENKNYEKAARLYSRAVEVQPDFYKASMYLGDAYFYLGYYEKAHTYFEEAVKKFPTLLEPRKYLMDTYLKMNLYKEAAEEALKALMIYPDYTLYDKYSDVLYMMGKKLKISWTPRKCFPNKMNADKDDSLEVLKGVKAGPWVYYQGAITKIKAYCNDKGLIVKQNDLTKARYLEVFSWEEMLNNNNDPSLEQARKMKQEGYLDCYVFITCFHIDFYEQYLDFVSKNKDRIVDYFKFHME